jgi:hypothetical protein
LAHVVSSLAYLNLFGNKRLGCYCWNDKFSVTFEFSVSVTVQETNQGWHLESKTLTVALDCPRN